MTRIKRAAKLAAHAANLAALAGMVAVYLRA